MNHQIHNILQDVTAPELGSIAIKGAVERAGINLDSIEEVMMGCVLQVIKTLKCQYFQDTDLNRLVSVKHQQGKQLSVQVQVSPHLVRPSTR